MNGQYLTDFYKQLSIYSTDNKNTGIGQQNTFVDLNFTKLPNICDFKN